MNWKVGDTAVSLYNIVHILSPDTEPILKIPAGEKFKVKSVIYNELHPLLDLGFRKNSKDFKYALGCNVCRPFHKLVMTESTTDQIFMLSFWFAPEEPYEYYRKIGMSKLRKDETIRIIESNPFIFPEPMEDVPIIKKEEIHY
jgi:hypothetical protein